jgi:hypothetical protein
MYKTDYSKLDLYMAGIDLYGKHHKDHRTLKIIISPDGVFFNVIERGKIESVHTFSSPEKAVEYIDAKFRKSVAATSMSGCRYNRALFQRFGFEECEKSNSLPSIRFMRLIHATHKCLWQDE